jgi:type VI secretion system protein ImpH
MAPSLRRDPRALIDLLGTEPQRFHVLQAVRLLERLRPRGAPAGLGNHAEDEAVRFRSRVDAVFPASDIDRLELTELPDRPAQMSVNFLGLAGAFGPLPMPITELAVARARAGDTAICDFLDIFNHRLVSLFCRLHRGTHVTLQPGLPPDGRTAAAIFALLGLGTEGLRRLMPPLSGDLSNGLDRGLLMPAALVARRPPSLHAVERLAAHYLALPVHGVPLQGRWLPLDPDHQTAIGRRGRNRILGGGAVLGRRVWCQQAAIRLDVGPLPLARALSLLPGEQTHQSLRSLLGFALGGTTDVGIRLIIPPADVPPARLSRCSGSRLGWTSWLGTRPRSQPAAVSIRLAPLTGAAGVSG